MQNITKKLLTILMTASLFFSNTPVRAEEPNQTGETTQPENTETIQENLNNEPVNTETAPENQVSENENTGETAPSEQPTGENTDNGEDQTVTDNTTPVDDTQNDAGDDTEGVVVDPAETPAQEQTEEETDAYDAFLNDKTIDFSSKRLIVATDASTIRENDPVIGEYNGIYLIQFETEEETAKAYAYYLKNAEFVEPDVTFVAAEGGNEDAPDGNEVDQLTDPMSEEENPMSELAKENEAGIEEVGTPYDNKHMVIAVIDSGINADDLSGSVSMLGDETGDDNGHGTSMYEAIRSVNPDVDIISIKALDKDGKGNASAIIAAIEYAKQAKVNLINMSLSAVGTPENSIVSETIKSAVSEGIIVVGAAGNSSKNAKYYIPGGVTEAIIIGSANDELEYSDSSNFGDTVDYIVKAESTSKAAALYSGMLTYAYMQNVNIASYPDFIGKLAVAPECLQKKLDEARLEGLRNI